MKKFRKKPVVIEAVQLTETNIKECYELIHDSIVVLPTQMEKYKWNEFEKIVIKRGLTVPTLEDGKDKRAKHVANIGDWIIKGVKGEFYPCKPDIFEMTYTEE